MSRARPRNNRPTAISLPSQFDTSHGSKASTLVDVPSSAQERGADIVGKMVSERQTEKSNSSASESSDQEMAVDDPSEEESLDPMLPAPSQLKLPSAKEVYDALPSQGTAISALISKVQGPIDRKHSKPFFPIVKAVTSFDNKRRWLTPLPQMPSKETIEKTINSTLPPKTVNERSEEEADPCACTSPKQSPWVHNIKMLSVQAPEKNIGEMQNEACQLADKHSTLVQALDGLQSTKLSKIAEIFRERDEVIRNEIREANEFAEERIRRINDHEQLLLGQLQDCFARKRQVEASLLRTDPTLFGMWANEEASESEGGRRLRSDFGNVQAYMDNKRRGM